MLVGDLEIVSGVILENMVHEGGTVIGVYDRLTFLATLDSQYLLENTHHAYAADWWHPWFYDRDVGWDAGRPAYENRPAEYQWKRDEDFRKYIDFVHA